MIEGKRGQSTVKFIHHLSWALPPSLSGSHGKFLRGRGRWASFFLFFSTANRSCSLSAYVEFSLCGLHVKCREYDQNTLKYSCELLSPSRWEKMCYTLWQTCCNPCRHTTVHCVWIFLRHLLFKIVNNDERWLELVMQQHETERVHVRIMFERQYTPSEALVRWPNSWENPSNQTFLTVELNGWSLTFHPCHAASCAEVKKVWWVWASLVHLLFELMSSRGSDCQ